MRSAIRISLFAAGLGLLLYLVWDIKLVRDGIFWIFMMYLVVGSLSGGARRVTAAFMGKSISVSQSGLGYSWYALTIWLLRKVFGLAPQSRETGPTSES